MLVTEWVYVWLCIQDYKMFKKVRETELLYMYVEVLSC